MSDDLQNLWQHQHTEIFSIALEQVRARARKFQRTVRFRNLREYLAAVVVTVVFTAQAIHFADPLRRIGAILVVAGAVYIAWHLHRWGSSKEVPANYLEFHRRELERQRDLLSNIWRWYLGPMIPGLFLITLAGLLDKRGAAHTAFVIVFTVLCALFFYGVGWWNRYGARRLQRQIDELDKLTKDVSE